MTSGHEDAGKLAELLAETTGLVAQIGQTITGYREQLRELDEGVQLARELGASDTEMLPILLTREQITSQIGALAEKKRAAEEWLAAAGQPS
jgi:uncharacterized phage infection (PIP) family protein YhgE